MANNKTLSLKNIYLSIKRWRTARIINSIYHKAPVVRCGSQCGGFSILVPKEKDNLVMMSFGIGTDLSFSEDIAKLLNPTIYAFDPTPKSIAYVKQHPLYSSPNFKFEEIGISDADQTVEFHLPKNPDYVSGSMEAHDGLQTEAIQVQMNTLATICKAHNIQKIDILKLDIEGSEFKVLPDALKSGIPISQICVETHERFFADKRQKIESLISTLAAAGYKCVSKDFVECVFTFVLE